MVRAVKTPDGATLCIAQLQSHGCVLFWLFRVSVVFSFFFLFFPSWGNAQLELAGMRSPLPQEGKKKIMKNMKKLLFASKKYEKLEPSR